MVPVKGIEPSAIALRMRCSTVLATPATPPVYQSPLDLSFAHQRYDVVSLTQCQRHNGQRWVIRCPGGELTSIRNEKILDVVTAPKRIHHTILRLGGHAASA